MSQFHEDHMQNKGEYTFEKPTGRIPGFDQTEDEMRNVRKALCIWPDCDCEIKCDHIACSPPTEELKSDKILSDVPRFRLYFDVEGDCWYGFLLPMVFVNRLCSPHFRSGLWCEPLRPLTLERG